VISSNNAELCSYLWATLLVVMNRKKAMLWNTHPLVLVGLIDPDTGLIVFFLVY